MNVPSYHQLLAEQYEENAKNLLVFHNEYEEDDVEYHSREDYETREVEDPEKFNAFHGDRGTEKILTSTQDFEDKTRNSIRYDKDVKTHVVNIDSRFRAYPKYNPLMQTVGPIQTGPTAGSNSANFVFGLPRLIKNASSIRITSISFPNVFYTFTEKRGNLSFDVYDELSSLRGTVRIPEGNYSTIQSLVNQIQNQLDTIPVGSLPNLTYPFTISYDSIRNLVTFSRTDTLQFGLNFTSPVNQPFNNSLGYNLGFSQLVYGTVPNQPTIPLELINGASVAQADSFPDLLGDPYVYLGINDYNIIEHQSSKQTFFTAFAKILLPQNSKNTIVHDIDLTNVVQREYTFPQPTNIQKLTISVYDVYGQIIDMKNVNFSFTLEIEEVLNPALYEKLRDL